MKLNNKKVVGLSWLLFATAITIAFTACKKVDQKSLGLGALPVPAFTATVSSDGHSVVAINNTSTPHISYWAVPSLNLGYADLKGDTAKLNFIFPGTYTITLLVDGQGGLDSIKKTVTTTQADPNACSPTFALGFIASCTQKTWKLNPAAGAYKVGPGPNDGSWWSNNLGDVTLRSCEFDDEYTFSFNAAGTFGYNSHGDFYGDGYMGNNTSTCQPESNYTAVQKPWGSGTFNYAVISGTGQNGLGQLKVIGLGAHIGLQKVTTNAENTSGPVNSITYDILSMTHDPGGYDIIVIGCNMGWGWWTFTLRSY